MANRNTQRARKQTYRRLLVAGQQRLQGGVSAPDPLKALAEEFQARRAAGDKVSIRAFCGEHRISQRQFEARLRPSAAEEIGPDPRFLAYYQRSEVQQALYLWAQGRRIALHYAQGVVGLGFRAPEDILLLAAASKTAAPSFHASVGRYEGTHLVACDLVAELDNKGDRQACFRATLPLVHALHNLDIPFLVKFSGHSSAHVVVPYRGQNYREASERFLRRVRGPMRSTSYLDLSFRSPQHLLRMPYALHERTGLVSLPLTVEEYERFTPEMARPENVTVDLAPLTRVLSADAGEWLLG